ncbi:MAG: putative bifunctional diguanylate cyclase/phosphodiesterase, partial [Wenzhouxiangellaceae bacterium]
AASKQAELQTQLRARFDRQMQWLFAVFGLLLLLAATTAWIVGRGLLRPIRALADATDRLEHGRFEGVELPHHREDELGNLIQNFNRMVRALRDHEQSIRQLAYQDPLTGLPNRLMFRELLDQAIAERIGQPASRLGLLFIDLDDFKRVNDTLGHDAGDTLLGEFAARLQGRLSKAAEKQESEKPLIARLGGDEFVALVSGDDLEERCGALARTMLDLLTEPFEIEGRSLWLGTSIGITTFPEDARTSRHLLKCGDLAMYQAKLEGKNGVCWYHDRLTVTAEENLALEQDLRQALQQDQIDVVYQPVVCMRTRRVTGAEALLRWRHPQRGEIEPEQFVAVAEGSTLINELGRFVMMRACTDAAVWQRRCPGLRVGINVSARQLMRRDLSDLVDEAIQASDLPAQCMSLELTESSLMQDRTVTANTLAELRKRGINVWLDDFGTGFSGLSHMRQLQVHGVKIDRSFIADITTDPDDLALTSAIIAMAHSIGMRVIAEGVETREQLALLTERNCDLAQGFLIARPMKAEEIPDFHPDPAL